MTMVRATLFRECLGEVLRELRWEHGFTLRQMSARAGVSGGYISEIERGQKEASSELLLSLCSALDTPLSGVLFDVAERIASSEALVVEFPAA